LSDAANDRSGPTGAGRPAHGRRLLGLLGRWPGATIAAVVALAGAAAAVCGVEWLARNAGQVVALLALVALWRRWVGPACARFGAREVAWRGWSTSRGALVVEILCPAAVVALVCVVFYRVFAGDAPLFNDHTNHFYQGWVMAERLLPSGRLTGWVSTRGAGYPAGVLYPIGANLLIAAVRYVTFGALEWDTTYAVAFVAAMALCHLSAYAAGRLLGGPFAGLLAGVFSAIDAGAYRQAGWTFAVHWGVWPVCLSAALAMLAVVVLHRALARPGAAGLVAFALLAAASLITHPMALAFLALAGPAAVVHGMIEARDRPPLRIAAKGLAAGATALALAAFWLVPFLAYRAEARTLGTGALLLRQQLDGLVRLGFFGGMWVVPTALALLGGLVAWWTPKPGVRLLTLLFALFALGFNGDTILGLGLDVAFPRLANVQPDRFYLFLRIFAYVLAGVGGGWIATTLRAAAPSAAVGLGPARRAALTLAACVAFGTVVVPGADILGRTVVANRLGWTGRPSFWADYQRVASFIRRDAAARGGFVRSTWPVPCPNRDIHCFQSSPVYTGIGHFHDHRYYTVCSFDRLFEMRGDDATLRLLGVRYRVARAPRRGERELFRSGALRVYEVEGVASEPFTIEGAGAATAALVEAGDERFVVRVTGARPGAALVLHVPYFPAWHATRDGRELPISLVDRATVRGLMRVPIEGDGEVVFEYRRGAPEWAGAAATLLGLALCLGLAWPRLLDRVAPVARGAHRVAQWADRPRVRRAALVAALLLAGVVSGGAFAVVAGPRGEARSFDAVRDFDRARVRVRSGRSVKTCRRAWLGDVSCGQQAHEWVGPRYVWTTMGFVRGALYAHPVKAGVLEIEYPGVRLDRSLIGGLGIAHGSGGGAPVTLELLADGAPLYEVDYRAGDGWDHFRVDTADKAGRTVDLVARVESTRVNRRHFVFRVWTSPRRVATGRETGDRTL
jgi:hypothetical protein